MSTGISISSINRIKELAEEKKYAEALEILDTQNLDKSINPQFLRISGEIFRENQRYYDSRRILLKAHNMSPQGLRIIAELIQLYLELGYFSKAEKYYEQYLFYTTPDDAQKEYVEYIMKKGKGADVKELAAILVPILERMPEDKWNFEAVLLYDKLDRKDKALDECRYILENFKDSIYVQPVIDYIDDKLDVDAYFYVYPKKEKEEDTELFADLIEEEEKLLQADYLRMYPPEAKIVVEAEDKEGIDIRPAKEKKPRRKKKKAAEKKSAEVDSSDEVGGNSNEKSENADGEGLKKSDGKSAVAVDETSKKPEEVSENAEEISEEQIKQEREAALEKLLSKKINTDQIKESAKQAAKAVKDIDTTRAKEQVKSVAEVVKGNVKKATDVFGEAVGVKVEEVEGTSKDSEEIVDGIIESVLEPPKKAVGQVVTNEELDALIPESLEAMSTEEIADIEERKAEEERLELQALEAQLKLEEEKKAKSRLRKASAETEESQSADTVEQETVFLNHEEYAHLKEQFLADLEEEEKEEQPLDSLGFIKVVQSDVDARMEKEIPDAAGILHQMIDNREFYTGEDSTKFESKASYDNHGFEVEDYEIADYEQQLDEKPTHAELYDNSIGDEDVPTVEIIYAQEDIIDFSEIIPEAAATQDEESVIEEKVSEELVTEESVEEEKVSEELVTEESVIEENVSEGLVAEESVEEEKVTEELVTEESVVEEVISEVSATEKTAEELDDNGPVAEKVIVETLTEEVEKESVWNEPVLEEFVMDKVKETPIQDKRQMLRFRILITDDMTRKLRDLKESR